MYFFSILTFRLINSTALFPMLMTLVRKEIKASAGGAEQKKGAHAGQQTLLTECVSRTTL